MNVLDLRNELSSIFEDYKNKKITSTNANTLANVAGKIIKSASSEIVYQKHIGLKRKINFFEYEK